MTIHVGDRIPEVPLKRIREGMETLDTNALFDGRKVVLFAVPGAFHPDLLGPPPARLRGAFRRSSAAAGIEWSTAWRSTTRS